MMGSDLGKAKGSLLSPPGLSLSMPSMDLTKGLPGLPPLGSDPKAAAMASMGKLGALPGLSMSAPSLGLTSPGNMSKAGQGMPDLGPPPSKGMPSLQDMGKGMPGMPSPGSDPKAAAMACLGKMGGMPGGMMPVSSKGGPMSDLTPPPSKAQMSGGMGMPPGLGGALMGSTAKGASPA